MPQGLDAISGISISANRIRYDSSIEEQVIGQRCGAGVVAKGITDGFSESSLIEHGHDPATKDIAGVCQMYCGESDEEAHRIGGPHVMSYYAFFAGLDQRSPHTSEAFASYRRSLAERKDEIKYEDLDRKNLLMIGSSETLIRRIRQLQDYYGTNYLLLEVAQGGMDPKNVVSSLERFAKEVMPAFRSDRPIPDPSAAVGG